MNRRTQKWDGEEFLIRASREICGRRSLAAAGRTAPLREPVFSGPMRFFRRRQRCLSHGICKLLITRCFPSARFRI